MPKSLVIPNFVIPTISGISKTRYNKQKFGIIKKNVGIIKKMGDAPLMIKKLMKL